jgi:hypothetical protein
MFDALGERPGNPIREVRWAYYAPVVQYINEAGFASALELGPGRCPVAGNAVLMDIAPCFDGLPLPILHDARETPWPVEDNAVELFVALQVLEHLEGSQRDAWLEVERIATRCAIISVPYRWKRGEHPGHDGITHETVRGWTWRDPARVEVVSGRAIYWYDMTAGHRIPDGGCSA